ncbi:MAG: hypothetical protein ACREP9_17295 [Candidatus Dormibacteraceae bacterium]
MRLRVASLASVLSVMVVGVLVFAGSAFASRGHEFSGSFGEPCVAEPCRGAQLKEPDWVAVNEVTGDVYVVDEGPNRVVRFSKEGAFLSESNGGVHLKARLPLEGPETTSPAKAVTGQDGDV